MKSTHNKKYLPAHFPLSLFRKTVFILLRSQNFVDSLRISATSGVQENLAPHAFPRIISAILRILFV
ncbi:MAG: hypothetical protein CO043_01845 [Parcubacteria group bacterium CG_4_9_14_0_2_um_filter_48_40]|nr:MAG: hypothetical protein CO043_01845 [Parcubacteria group bacterium CG_4_9_14_0_2_um_filter_48_40]